MPISPHAIWKATNLLGICMLPQWQLPQLLSQDYALVKLLKRSWLGNSYAPYEGALLIIAHSKCGSQPRHGHW